MARHAKDGRVTVYPTGWIEISGRTKAGHELEITLGREEAEVLVQAFKLEEQMEDGHLGHAFWHARQPEIAFPCSTCSIKDKLEGYHGPSAIEDHEREATASAPKIDIYTWDGYRGPSAITQKEREANVNEILDFEERHPEGQADFIRRLSDEVTGAIQDPNKGRK